MTNTHASPFTKFETLAENDSSLQPLRAALYKTDGPGYVVLKNYIEPKLVKHLRNFWTETPPPEEWFDKTLANKDLQTIGQRPYLFKNKARTIYRQYTWNYPIDQVSLMLCMTVTMLRNQLEQQDLYRFLLPQGSHLATYRVVHTVNTNTEEDEVPLHTDTWDESVKHSKFFLQATLVLSEQGKDYDGEGFYMYNNQGEKVVFGKDVDVKPGDLIVWRYFNQHGVGKTIPIEGGKGFLRILFPNEAVTLPQLDAVKTPSKKKSLTNKLGQRFEKVFRGTLKQLNSKEYDKV